MTWYLLWIKTDDILVAPRTWMATLLGNYWCDECRLLYPWVRSIDIMLRFQPPSVPINALGGPGDICVVYHPFLDILGEQAVDAFYFGNVLDPGGNRLEDFRTYRAKDNFIFLRGNRESDYRGRCKACGQRRRYFPGGKSYVLSRDLGAHAIYGTHMGLLVNEEVFGRIGGKRWPGLGVEKIPVLDEPRDGLPVDL